MFLERKVSSLRVAVLAAGVKKKKKRHFSYAIIKLKPEVTEASTTECESLHEICVCCSVAHLETNPFNMQYLKSRWSGAFSMWQQVMSSESGSG